jgi:hypothetical protein
MARRSTAAPFTATTTCSAPLQPITAKTDATPFAFIVSLVPVSGFAAPPLAPADRPCNPSNPCFLWWRLQHQPRRLRGGDSPTCATSPRVKATLPHFQEWTSADLNPCLVSTPRSIRCRMISPNGILCRILPIHSCRATPHRHHSLQHFLFFFTLVHLQE